MVVLGFFDRKKQKTPIGKVYSAMPWPDHVVTLQTNTFHEFIQAYPVTLVDFWAPWCAPCRTMAPRLRRLSKLYKNEVAFGTINIQDYQDVAKEYNILGIPCFILFQQGKKRSSITGVRSVGEIKDTLDALLKKLQR